MTQMVDSDMRPADAPDTPLHRHPGLRRLVLFELAVMTTSQVWFVVLTWLLVARSGSGTTVGLVLMAGALPRAALMLVGGTLIDRRDPVRVLHTATAALATVLAAATAVEVTVGLGIWHLLVFAALVGATDAFVWPAVTALIPRLVESHRLDAAHAAVQLCDQATQIAGPVLAGVLLATGGAGAALGADAALAAVAVIASFALAAVIRRRPPAAGTGTASVVQDLLEGLRFVRRQPDVRLGVVAAALLSLVTVGPVSVGGTLLAADRFGGPGALGVLLGAFGVGAVVGVLAAGRHGARWHLRPVLIATFASLGVGLAGIGLAPTLWVAAPVAAITAVVSGAAGVVVMAAVQRATPDALHGRVAGLIGFAYVALDPVSQGLAGLAVRAGAGPLLVGSGLLSALVAVVSLLSSPSRRSHA